MAEIKDIITVIENLYRNADGKNQFLQEKCLPLYDASIKMIETDVPDPAKKGGLLYKCWFLKRECLLRNQPDNNQISDCNSKLRELGKFKEA